MKRTLLFLWLALSSGAGVLAQAPAKPEVWKAGAASAAIAPKTPVWMARHASRAKPAAEAHMDLFGKDYHNGIHKTGAEVGGTVVLRPRGTDAEGLPTEWRGEAEIDVLAAIEELRRRIRIDPERIDLFGNRRK